MISSAPTQSGAWTNRFCHFRRFSSTISRRSWQSGFWQDGQSDIKYVFVKLSQLFVEFYPFNLKLKTWFSSFEIHILLIEIHILFMFCGKLTLFCRVGLMEIKSFIFRSSFYRWISDSVHTINIYSWKNSWFEILRVCLSLTFLATRKTLGLIKMFENFKKWKTRALKSYQRPCFVNTIANSPLDIRMTLKLVIISR